MKYFLDMKDEYSDVKNISDSSEVYIEGVYFGYVPKGFKHEVTSKGNSTIVIDFSNENKDYFTLTITISKWNNKVNTEERNVEDLIVNEKDIIYFEKDDVNYLSWTENKCLCLLGSNIEKQELINILEKIKIDDISPQN